MHIARRLSRKASRVVGHILATGMLVMGAGVGPVMATAVAVDQSPLTIQRSLPPNVVLMLDDSGSMDWDYMPDWGYLSDNSNDGVRNAAINGAYYNPAITYAPPPRANGTLYPNSPGLTNAYYDGFRDSSGTDVTQYNDNFRYYETFSVPLTSTYPATLGCNGSDTLMTSGKNSGQCRSGWSGNYTYYAPTYRCNSGDTGPGPTNQCTSTTTVTKYLFTYTTGSGNTRNYVGQTGDCALLPAASAAVCQDSAAVQQNVANWFSYYRKRILLAKSGLMKAFVTLDETFRVGFGSIDGGDSGNNNYKNLPANRFSYSDDYNGGTNYVARVNPFGVGTDSTSTKSQFWNWVEKAKASGGTPLRQALNAVGTYYGEDQPWTGMASDPDYTTAAASNQLACRQSYTILTTDGFWNENFNDAGDVDGTSASTVTGPNDQSYAYSPALPYTDSGVTQVADNYDSTCPSGYDKKKIGSVYQCTKKNVSNIAPSCNDGGTLNGNQKTCQRTKTVPGTSYSNTLADVAMKYWRTDLKTGMANEVPTNGDDPAFWQHMTTFTLGMGFDAKDGTGTLLDDARMAQIFAWASGDATKAISGFSWPKPASNSVNNIADLAHAAVNGHGGFFSAKDPDGFANGIKEALKRAAERVGTGASLAANSTQLQTGTVAYQANYWTAKWKGDLKALAVDSTTGAIATSPTWMASGNLPTVASRNIKTFNPAATGASQYVDFKVSSGGVLPALSTTQHTALKSVVGAAADEKDLINYLRGDNTKEKAKGGSFRDRDTPIGDIVNSQPVYAGAPDPNQFYTQAFTGSTAFAAYASAQKSRAGTIYVSANDGMLHGFDATTGAERYAYLPGAVITNGISALASLDYGGTAAAAHGFFNDGELTIADAYMGSPASWKTVLVGTTGRGVAKAVYALDITDPTAIKFLWERSAGDGKTDSNYIGQMTGKPVIAQTANGSWSVLMGNGYNSVAGKSALLQFELGDGTLHVHATTDTSGLAAPAVWMDPSGNGVSTVAYAGDASGNVWTFPLNTSAGTTATATPDSNGSLIFVARDDANNAQPITAGMLIGRDPATGNTWVFFGTGRYLSTADLANTSVQSWYGLIVQSPTAGLAVTSAATRSTKLVKRAITDEAGSARALTTLGEAAAANTSIAGKSGWYLDLVSPVAGKQGERMATPNQFQGNMLIGTSRVPKATDPCNPSGSGWIMAIDPFTGTNPTTPFFDVNGDGKVDSGDTVNDKPAFGVGFGSLPNNPIFVGSTMLTSFDNGSTSSKKTAGSGGGMQRVSWRELTAH